MDKDAVVILPVMIADAWVAFTDCARTRPETIARTRATVAGVAVASTSVLVVALRGAGLMLGVVNGLTLVYGGWGVVRRVRRMPIVVGGHPRASEQLGNLLAFAGTGLLGLVLGICLYFVGLLVAMTFTGPIVG